jgi:glutamyl-tRNA synthetase
LEIYRQHAQQLIDSGKAYYCFATSEELEEMRKQQALAHTPPRYDRRYRDLSLDEAKQKIANGEKYVIRQAMPLDQTITVHDELRGDITFNTNELEDHVLIKSDGWPTYQLASVVDDHLMKITHVTRGDEWLPSLPKNILLYQAFEWEPPLFIHLPLILNKTGGGKLSKRQGDVFVENYLEKGYLPEAIINFCVLLGWHPKDDQEFFSLSELVSIFNLDGIGTSPAIFDEEKLNSINSYYLRKKNIDELLEAALPFFKPLLKDAPDHKKTPKFLKSVLALEQPRLKYLAELTESSALFFASSLEYDVSLLNWKKLNLEQTKANLEELYGYLQNISTENWTQAYLETEVINYLKTGDKALGDYLWPLRVSLSGQKASPGPFEIATVLGKDETLAKIKAANGLIDKNML